MNDKIIEITGLVKKYGSHTVVDNLNLTISKGEIFGLLGPNGAGKSTTILMLLGLTEPTSGSVKVCGIDSSRNPIEVKKRAGYLPEDLGFYDDLTGLENLIFTARLNRFSEEEAFKKSYELLERVGLTDAADKKTGKYSRGMTQRLGLADVLIKNPEVIILDEPTLGIDPKGVREFLDLIVRLSKEEGITVLLSSHHLHQVQQICDRVGLFVSGKLIAEGDISKLSQKLFNNSPFIIEAGIDEITRNNKKSAGIHDPVEKLTSALENTDGIMTVQMKENVFHIECSRDLTKDIARIIVESGIGLNSLNKKEYGLDDIYYHYFEEAEDIV